MVSELAIALLIPLAFWVFEVLIKVLGDFSLDDVGADLCLFGVSFNGSAMLAAAVSTRAYAASAGAILVGSLLLYIFSMILVSPRRFPYPAVRWLQTRTWKVSMTVFLGFTALVAEITLYYRLLQLQGS
jgi:hypothetical protein